MLAGMLLAAGCSAESPREVAGEVDPQVLQDVTSAAFVVPGPEIARTRRVNAFILGLGIVKCGGEPPPLDMTSDRIAQDLFPDLKLIRREGFGGDIDHRDLALESMGPDCPDLLPGLTSYVTWSNLNYEWTLRAHDVRDGSEAVARTKADAAACLRDRTGLQAEDDDPTTFLRSVTYEVSKGQSSRADEMGYAEAYADCTAEYFETMAFELLGLRPEYVERNRELLERFAAEISDAGYVP